MVLGNEDGGRRLIQPSAIELGDIERAMHPVDRVDGCAALIFMMRVDCLSYLSCTSAISTVFLELDLSHRNRFDD